MVLVIGKVRRIGVFCVLRCLRTSMRSRCPDAASSLPPIRRRCSDDVISLFGKIPDQVKQIFTGA